SRCRYSGDEGARGRRGVPTRCVSPGHRGYDPQTEAGRVVSDPMKPAVRIANGQGFWGDSVEAPVEQVRRGPIDYLTLDYLAEVTMSILQKQRSRDPRTGYARDFVDMIARGARQIVNRKI